MSALVDIWTSELAKMRNGAQTASPSGPIPAAPESTQVVQAQGNGSTTLITSVLTKLKSRLSAHSEASLFMLVECCSP
ncbi:hypothetical protein Acr_06g0015890 [Actinidia rufa]|uniref:Uncharacterized protein n=1 Tax=Actinidia rufa TaxID=165716 RepID=A0A7J0EUK4_9ERIC|nr:hypothetical protein Acr_06g0015890 [Actinidia rufa]